MAVSSDGVVTATVDPVTASILLTVDFTVAGSPVASGSRASITAITVTENVGNYTVRGLSSASAPGGIVTGVDHEAQFGTSLSYVAKAYNSAGTLLGTSTAAGITLPLPVGGFATWLKVLSTPSMSVSPDTSGPPEWTADIKTSLIQVIGRPDPIVVQDVRQYEVATLEVYTQTQQQQAAMQALLSSTAGPYLLQFPGYSEPDRYVMLGAYKRSRVAYNAVDPIRTWSFTVTQVVRPPVAGWSVAVPGHTYADSTARWPLYSDRTGTYNQRSTT